MKDFKWIRFEQRMAKDPRFIVVDFDRWMSEADPAGLTMAKDPRFTVEYRELERRLGPKLRTLSSLQKRLVYTALVKRYDSMLQQLNAIAGGGGYGGSGASSPPLQPVPWPRSDLSPDPKETWDAVKPN